MTARICRSAALAAVLLLWAPGARAQTPVGPDPSKVRLHLGPVLINPTISLTNAGVDTNVFDESDDQNPKSDFNVTITPQTDLWLPMGRTWLNSEIKEDIVWYKKYSSERSANTNYSLKWLVPLSRVSFNLGGGWVSARERPGFEIDARVHQRNLDLNGLAEFQALSQTYFGVRIDRSKLTFDDGAEFLGVDLRDQLSRATTVFGLTARHQLTPLTALTIEGTEEQDRFEFEPERDSDSNALNIGLKFDPLALINGSATVGFRRFSPADPTVPGFTGTTTAVNLSYVLGSSSTKVSVDGSRDVQYSYDINQPYYLQTGASLTVSQQVYGPVDVQGRIARQRLAYRTRADAVIDTMPDRVDHVQSQGAGLGYHFGQDIRLAFNIDYQRRQSELADHAYHGLRYGTSITYGF